MDHSSPSRTIAVTTRTGALAGPLKIRYPDGHPRASTRRRTWRQRLTTRYPTTTEHPDYNPELALELISNTSDIPDTRYDLVVVLTEYRHALHALATQALTTARHD